MMTRGGSGAASSRRVASSPSIAGIWTSIRTTSGSPPADDLEGLGSVRCLADDLDVGLGLEDPPEPDADQLLVVDEHDADRAGHDRPPSRPNGTRATTAKPPADVGPASTVPPTASARSCMPGMPMPPPGRGARGGQTRRTVLDRQDQLVADGPERQGRPRRRRRVAGHWSALPGRSGTEPAGPAAAVPPTPDRRDRSASMTRPASRIRRHSSARSASVGGGGAGRPATSPASVGPLSPPSGWRRVVTSCCISRTAARLEASIALNAAAVSAGDRSSDRRAAAASMPMRLTWCATTSCSSRAIDRRCSRRAAAARPARSRRRRSDHRTTAPIPTPRLAAAEERVLVGSALDERAQEDDEPERRRHGDIDGVRVAIGQGRAVRVGHGPQA